MKRLTIILSAAIVLSIGLLTIEANAQGRADHFGAKHAPTTTSTSGREAKQPQARKLPKNTSMAVLPSGKGYIESAMSKPSNWNGTVGTLHRSEFLDANGHRQVIAKVDSSAPLGGEIAKTLVPTVAGAVTQGLFGLAIADKQKCHGNSCGGTQVINYATSGSISQSVSDTAIDIGSMPGACKNPHGCK